MRVVLVHLAELMTGQTLRLLRPVLGGGDVSGHQLRALLVHCGVRFFLCSDTLANICASLRCASCAHTLVQALVRSVLVRVRALPGATVAGSNNACAVGFLR